MTLGFNPEFIPLILNGTKIHTIRSSQRWAAGQPIHFRATGPAGELLEFRPAGVVTAVQAIRITAADGTATLTVDGRPLPGPELHELARRDGFGSPALLLRFFADTYELPFEGQLIHWTDVRY